MAKTVYETYENVPAIGVMELSNYGGLEILDIIPGINDQVVACFNWGNGRTAIRHHKVFTTPSGRDYIRKFDERYYLDQIMFVGGNR